MPTKPQILGIPVVVDWGKLLIGASFFVPAPLVITQQLKRQLIYAADTHGYGLLIEEVAETGLTGIRVWRIR